jgi:hypothetical protein
MLMVSETAAAKTEDFSLVMGGPLYQMLLRAGLVKPPLDRLKWRMLVITLTLWAPLLALAIFDGRFLGGVKVPFLKDFEVHARLLAALPLLIVAEVVVHFRMKAIVRQFVERRIIMPPVQNRLLELIESAVRLRGSVGVELFLLVCVYLVGGFSWRAITSLNSDTWYATLTPGAVHWTSAGFWYRWVSLPLFQFILLRWYFRLFIWIRFLWQVSKLDLNLVPTHPDRSCGLGFLGAVVPAMAPFLLAHSCMFSGAIANHLVHDGAKLPDFYVEIGTLAVFLLLVTLGPLCLFTGVLLRAKLMGLRKYGRFASEYAMGFERKWIGGQRPEGQDVLGAEDIQSLADMANVYAVIQSIIPFPFGKGSLIILAVIIALPLLPLGLTMFSFKELVMRLVKLLL